MNDSERGTPPPRDAIRVPRRGLAWGVSLAVHLALAALLLWGLRQAAREREPDLERLVYVEPAPPPPAAALEDVHPAPHAESEAQTEPERLAEIAETPRPTPPQPTATRRTTPTVRPTRRRPPAPTAAVAVAAPTRVAVESAPAAGAAGGATEGGVAGGVPGGVPGGKVGGVVGGRGDEVVSAETVAKQPVLIHRVLPDYPVEARAKKVEGQVLLRAIIDRDGRIEDNVIVLRSLPPLDEAAIAALRQWRFTPGRDREGNAVRVRVDVPLRFKLK